MKRFSWALVAVWAFGLGAPVHAEKKTFNLDREHVPGQLVVGFDTDVPIEIRDLVVRKLGSTGPSLDPSMMSGGGVFLLEPTGLADKDSLYETARYIDSLPGVRFVEANNIHYLQEIIPDDPLFDRLYGLRNGDIIEGQVRKDINATFAWNITTGSSDILVGVLDTGIDYNHEDIIDNYWFNPGELGEDEDGQDRRSNGADSDGNGFVDDWRGWDFYNNKNDPMDGHGHGTHCAGTIGARGDNGIGVAGVNWNVSMVGIKIFSDAGVTNTAAIVGGIDYATTIGVHLTSNSWGGGPYSDAIYEAISRANDAGILFVAAAGNSRADNDARPHYPSSYDLPNIISVASTDRNDQLSSFSSYGLSSVHVAAPGSDIYSTIPNNQYGFKSGTSMATPHVAGLVALVMSQFRDLGHIEIKNRIFASSRQLPNLDGLIAFGRIDALAALKDDDIPPSRPTGLQIEEKTLRSLIASWNPSGDDGDIGEAARYEVRGSDEAITEDNWDSAEVLQVTRLESDDGRIRVSIGGWDFNHSGYLAVKAFDSVANESEVSDSVEFALPKIHKLFENLGNLDQDFEFVDLPWDNHEVDGRLIISDSPGKNYENNVNASITTIAFNFNYQSLFVNVINRYDLENNFDFAFIEIQQNDGDWQTLETLNGSRDWHTIFIDISDFSGAESSFRLRFRISTDSSVTRAGWDIDSINIATVESGEAI